MSRTPYRDLIDETAREVDTEGTEINVSETYRVISTFFKLLSRKSGWELCSILAAALDHCPDEQRGESTGD